MTVGNYKIGRYHGILRKDYADGSHDYETRFSDEADIYESLRAITSCIGKTVGIATEQPRVLTGVSLIRGKEAIEKELAPDLLDGINISEMGADDYIVGYVED